CGRKVFSSIPWRVGGPWGGSGRPWPMRIKGGGRRSVARIGRSASPRRGGRGARRGLSRIPRLSRRSIARGGELPGSRWREATRDNLGFRLYGRGVERSILGEERGGDGETGLVDFLAQGADKLAGEAGGVH